MLPCELAFCRLACTTAMSIQRPLRGGAVPTADIARCRRLATTRLPPEVSSRARTPMKPGPEVSSVRSGEVAGHCRDDPSDADHGLAEKWPISGNDGRFCMSAADWPRLLWTGPAAKPAPRPSAPARHPGTRPSAPARHPGTPAPGRAPRPGTPAPGRAPRSPAARHRQPGPGTPAPAERSKDDLRLVYQFGNAHVLMGLMWPFGEETRQREMLACRTGESGLTGTGQVVNTAA